eukprot:scaffold11949_cov38-Phaeocystis_antarctica.AAC.1
MAGKGALCASLRYCEVRVCLDLKLLVKNDNKSINEKGKQQAEPEAEASADEGLSDEEGAPEAPAAAPTRRQPARKNRKPVEFLRGIWGPKELKGDDQAVDKLLWYPARIVTLNIRHSGQESPAYSSSSSSSSSDESSSNSFARSFTMLASKISISSSAVARVTFLISLESGTSRGSENLPPTFFSRSPRDEAASSHGVDQSVIVVGAKRGEIDGRTASSSCRASNAAS